MSWPEDDSFFKKGFNLGHARNPSEDDLSGMPEDDPNKKVLSYEEFSNTSEMGIPEFNNMYTLFTNSFSGEAKRKHEFYKQFAQEYPELNQELLNKLRDVTSPGKNLENIKPYFNDLYEAYLKMREFTDENNPIFS